MLDETEKELCQAIQKDDVNKVKEIFNPNNQKLGSIALDYYDQDGQGFMDLAIQRNNSEITNILQAHNVPKLTNWDVFKKELRITTGFEGRKNISESKDEKEHHNEFITNMYALYIIVIIITAATLGTSLPVIAALVAAPAVIWATVAAVDLATSFLPCLISACKKVKRKMDFEKKQSTSNKPQPVIIGQGKKSGKQGTQEDSSPSNWRQYVPSLLNCLLSSSLFCSGKLEMTPVGQNSSEKLKPE